MKIRIRVTDDFDKMMALAPPGAEIQIDPGIYITKGRVEVEGTVPLIKTGQRIRGAGSGKTIIQLIDHNETRLHGMFLGLYNEIYEDVLIEHLTFDLGMYAGMTIGGAVSAIGLRGRRITVRDCRFINWGNKSDLFESFIVSLGAPWEREHGSQLSIRDCLADTPMPNSMGGAVTVFCIGGGTSSGGYRAVAYDSAIKNCTVYGDHYKSMIHAYQLSAASGLVVSDCHARNVEFGVYHDTWRNDAMIVRNCQFENCKSGMFFNLGRTVNGDLASEGSLILLDNRIVCPNDPDQSGIAMWGNGNATPLCDLFHASGNIIRNKPGAETQPCKGLQLYAYRCRVAVFTDNFVEPVPGSPYPVVMANQCTTVHAQGNVPRVYNYTTKVYAG